MREKVVRITAGSKRGTGFVPAAGYIVTALHVVARRRVDPPQFHDSIECGFARFDDAGTYHFASVEAMPVPGCFNREDDWVVLAYDPEALAWEPEPLLARRLDEDEVRGTRLFWRTYGFPEANPRQGMAATGHVKTLGTLLEERAVIGLFSHEAAAGDGMPVQGFSGAPVFVEGTVVGMLRWATFNQEQVGSLARSEGGSLYATPVDRLRLPDGGALPEAEPGLPAVPLDPHTLPRSPFRYLERYEKEDAPIFFGRRRDLARFFEVCQRGGSPVLLYGESGVGKSSFLRAGVDPRWPSAVAAATRGGDGLETSWERLAALPLAGTRPLRILDQVEEAWTQGGGRTEFDALLSGMDAWLRGPATGVVVLAFRKEWLSEVDQALLEHGMRSERFSLEALDWNGIVQTMRGFEHHPEIGGHYGIFFEENLPERIADELITGQAGVVTPVLQTLLTRLWENAQARAAACGEARKMFTLEDWEAERDQGLSLRRFVREVVQTLAAEGWRSEFEGGLMWEVLNFHVTPAGTAGVVSDEELVQAFPGQPKERLLALVDALKAKWLLAEAPRAHRLAHDALAPIVHRMRTESSAPAQTAWRILESLAVEWRAQGQGSLLGVSALRLVQKNLPYMKAPDEETRALLDASRRANHWSRRGGRMLARALFALIVVLGIPSAVAFLLDRSESLHRMAAASHFDGLHELDWQLITLLPDIHARFPLEESWRRTWPGLGESSIQRELAYRRGRASLPISRDFITGPVTSDLLDALDLAAWLDGFRDGSVAGTKLALHQVDLEENETLRRLIWLRWQEQDGEAIDWDAFLNDLEDQLIPGRVDVQEAAALLPISVWKQWVHTDFVRVNARHFVDVIPPALVADLSSVFFEDLEVREAASLLLTTAKISDELKAYWRSRLFDVVPSPPSASDPAESCQKLLMALKSDVPDLLANDEFLRWSAECELNDVANESGSVERREAEGLKLLLELIKRVRDSRQEIPDVLFSPPGDFGPTIYDLLRRASGFDRGERQPLERDIVPRYFLLLSEDPEERVLFLKGEGLAVDLEAWEVTYVAAQAAEMAKQAGLTEHARRLHRWLADHACPMNDFYVQIKDMSIRDWILEGLVDLEMEEETRRCLAVPKVKPLESPISCSVYLALGDSKEAVRCVDGPRISGEIYDHVALAAGLAEAREREAAGRLLESWHVETLASEARDWAFPLWSSWLSATREKAPCGYAGALGLGYARLGAVRNAHLFARRCARKGIQAHVLVELLAQVEEMRPWATRRLAFWTPAAVGSYSTSEPPTVFTRRWLLDEMR